MSSYEQSAEERRLLLERAQRRAVLRAEFLKQTTNPFVHGEGGNLYDPGYYRHQAMRVSLVDYFRPTSTTLHRNAKEHQYRTGQVAYKDRKFKFI
ncbi:hypothetical protein Bhyg_12670 [Pseudolycoriella hygida]|uniref:NADH dehydrogenase [ubiquinone] 1 beta subcomplex subunit 4 n=1 Tax=Pseudolycoriella hygida TaxID=35572 RepID=A0A9Q0MXX1_9DIPT|nr:hypothetical protein Bhyg_12670 [Pseudolycoriella hygida]